MIFPLAQVTHSVIYDMPRVEDVLETNIKIQQRKTGVFYALFKRKIE